MRHLRDIELIELSGGRGMAAPDAQAHLGACDECRRRFEELSRVHDALGTWVTEGGTPDLWPAIAERLDRPPTFRVPIGQRIGIRLLRAAATILIGAVLGHGLGRVWLATPQAAAPADEQIDAALALEILATPSATGLGAVLAPAETEEMEDQP